MKIEERITHIFGTEADAAPLPGPTFRAGVDRHVQRRRTRRHTVRALGVATLVLGLAGTWLAVDRHPAAVTDPRPATTSEAPTPAPRPFAEVWPGTTRTLPGRLPDGGEYAIRAVLDPDTYVVSRTGTVPAGPAGEVLVLDNARHTTRSLVRATRPGDDSFGVVAVAAAEGQVAYVTSGVGTGAVWLVPVTGGSPRKVADLALTADQGPRDIELVIAAGDVAWSPTSGVTGARPGVWRAALSGGPARMVPGSEGMTLTAWPWLVANAHDQKATAPPTLLNADTGERRTAVRAVPVGPLTCSPSWCLGLDSSGPYLQRLDGTGFRTGVPTGTIVADRFVFGFSMTPAGPDQWRFGDPEVYDLGTGRRGVVRSRTDNGHRTWSYGGGSALLLYWSWEQRPDTYEIVDFTLIR
ncbi:hypothetical protein AB0M43_00205 [Longispora sp. NPDC051575]|uniref:hypothetical protein n=1 Tax=Longispora sp. NPDC051575 TaxID=3154943 RepID=UPI00341BF095